MQQYIVSTVAYCYKRKAICRIHMTHIEMMTLRKSWKSFRKYLIDNADWSCVWRLVSYIFSREVMNGLPIGMSELVVSLPPSLLTFLYHSVTFVFCHSCHFILRKFWLQHRIENAKIYFSWIHPSYSENIAFSVNHIFGWMAPHINSSSFFCTRNQLLLATNLEQGLWTSLRTPYTAILEHLGLRLILYWKNVSPLVWISNIILIQSHFSLSFFRISVLARVRCRGFISAR